MTHDLKASYAFWQCFFIWNIALPSHGGRKPPVKTFSLIAKLIPMKERAGAIIDHLFFQYLWKVQEFWNNFRMEFGEQFLNISISKTEISQENLICLNCKTVNKLLWGCGMWLEVGCTFIVWESQNSVRIKYGFCY